jgi:uncharacterized membrane protein YdjX (TVP38/TMEM64 family)
VTQKKPKKQRRPSAGSGGSKGKWIAAGVAAAALIAAWYFLPLKAWLEAIEGRIDAMGVLGGVLFGLAYVGAELLLVPGAILTVGAGYLFGIVGGMAVVWPSATVAAALAFLLARYVARERVATYARRHRKFAATDAAIEQGGWKVVALLRFSPVVPFALSNYLYGLTKIGFVPYIAATALGMLPGTFLYVYLGGAGRSFGAGGKHSVWHWVLLAAGLVATVAATVYVTRVAKKKLHRRKAA